MCFSSLVELQSALSARRVSSVELTQEYLKIIHKNNATLNALITVTEELALSQAHEADLRISKNEATPLTGIPLIHKDLFCTEGVRTTCGSRMLDNFISPYDATLVHNLKSAGMIMLGKANMDEFAMGSSNENSFYGPVKNPWDLTRTPGGSSGGSSAAVAAGFAPVSTGSDTGGSVRQPAALCGLTGLKPTYGRISRYGMVAFASSLDQAGLFTRSAEDAAWVMAYMAGFDPRDSTSVNCPVPYYPNQLKRPLQGLKIGIPKEFFGEGLDASVDRCVQEAIQTYEKLGATLHEVSLPHMSLALPVYYVLAPAECSANLARYDGIRFGHRCHNPIDLEDLYTRSRSEGFGSEVKRRILIGTYVLSSSHYEGYYVQAQKVRSLITEEHRQVFEKVDLLICPSTPTTAFKLGEKSSNPLSLYLSDVYTLGASLAGLPALSIPVGMAQGLPVGLQLIGRHFEEGLLLNAAHAYQLTTDWHLKTPPSITDQI